MGGTTFYVQTVIRTLFVVFLLLLSLDDAGFSSATSDVQTTLEKERQKFDTLLEILELKKHQVDQLERKMVELKQELEEARERNASDQAEMLVLNARLPTDFDLDRLHELREEVREMFTFSWDMYIAHAYPDDELQPLTCNGKNVFGKLGMSLSLIDGMDTFAVMGDVHSFRRAISKVVKEVTFDTDVNVSVFETIIRSLGGLLSSHFLAIKLLPDWYEDDLLPLALDLGHRLLPAFKTQTGIPYGTVNLRYGVPDGETVITSAAGGGSNLLEFAMLSRVTGEPEFERVATVASIALWSRRSPLGLVGNHINIMTGHWTHQDSGIGTNVDSFYEYIAKAYLLLDNHSFLFMFGHCYNGISTHLRRDDFFVDSNMFSGVHSWTVFSSLASFWPGLEALYGVVDRASQTQHAIHNIWRKYGGFPEAYNIDGGFPQPGNEGYPLRPETIESLMYLHESTADTTWLHMGVDILTSLQNINRVKCGYAGTLNVATRQLANRMDSYFLAETCKYLYLLFDPEHYLRKDSWVFTTEGHPLPIDFALKHRISTELPEPKNLATGLGCLRPSYIYRHRLNSVHERSFNSLQSSKFRTNAKVSKILDEVIAEELAATDSKKSQQTAQDVLDKQRKWMEENQRRTEVEMERQRRFHVEAVELIQRREQEKRQASQEILEARRDVLERVGRCVFFESGQMLCSYKHMISKNMWSQTCNVSRAPLTKIDIFIRDILGLLGASSLDMSPEERRQNMCVENEQQLGSIPSEIGLQSLLRLGSKSFLQRRQANFVQENNFLFNAVIPKRLRYMRAELNWHLHWEQQFISKGQENGMWWVVHGGWSSVNFQRVSLLLDLLGVRNSDGFVKLFPNNFFSGSATCRRIPTRFGAVHVDLGSIPLNHAAAPLFPQLNDGPWRWHPWLESGNDEKNFD